MAYRRMATVWGLLVGCGGAEPPPVLDAPVRLAVFEPTEKRLKRARKIVAAGKPFRGRGGIWFSRGGLIEAALPPMRAIAQGKVGRCR